MNAHSRRRVSICLFAIATCGQAAHAQTQQQDHERLRRDGVERNDAAARAHGMEQNRQLQERERQAEEQRRSSDAGSPGGGYRPPGGTGAGAGPGRTDFRALGKELLRLPPLPDERNVLLGRWRLEGGGPQRGIAEFGLTGRGPAPGLGEMMGFLSSMESGKLLCDMSFGSGITFAPASYSSGGAAGIAGGPIAYRSRNKNVIVAIPGDSRANPMPFTIAGPNRILWADTCTLVRIGAPGAHAPANASTAPGTARTAAANSSLPTAAGAMPQVVAVAPSPPPSTLSRPSPEVCRNTLLDKLGTVGSNQVRAMSDARFREAAIEGKVPNTNNLRLDLRGSACDDPRIKATLYDFDAHEMLRSITYVWDRPPGPAPTLIFIERVGALSRSHPSLPQPQTTGRLQGETALGRLILQDMPERNLLLEAYVAKN